MGANHDERPLIVFIALNDTASSLRNALLPSPDPAFITRLSHHSVVFWCCLATRSKHSHTMSSVRRHPAVVSPEPKTPTFSQLDSVGVVLTVKLAYNELSNLVCLFRRKRTSFYFAMSRHFSAAGTTDWARITEMDYLNGVILELLRRVRASTTRYLSFF